MGLLAELGIDGGAVNIGDIEKQMASGGLPPEGVHHAVLDAAGPIPNAAGRGWKLTFKIIAGPGAGEQVEEVLWKPKGDDAKKDARIRNRITLFAHRLGLLKKVTGPDGKESAVEVEGKHDFCDCLGAACFVDVKHEEREYEKDGKKHKIKEAKLSFEGCISPEDKRVKDVPKAGSATVASAALSRPAPAPKDNLADL